MSRTLENKGFLKLNFAPFEKSARLDPRDPVFKIAPSVVFENPRRARSPGEV